MVIGMYLMYYSLGNFLMPLYFYFLKRQYIVYPPEGPRPPSPEELREMAREVARKRERERSLKD